MNQTPNSKRYDLEERTFLFAQRVKKYLNHLSKTVAHIEISKQLMRSAGSIGANYIEANEAMSKKDFLYRCKISKKEAKETRYWIRLTDPEQEYSLEQEVIEQEAFELMKILGGIINKSKNRTLEFEI